MSQVMHADETSFENEVIQSKMPVLVDFSATWCGPCKKLEPLLDEIAGDYTERVKIVKIDVDKAPTVAAKYGVMSVPTLLFFSGGDVRDEVRGLVPKKAITDRLDKVL